MQKGEAHKINYKWFHNLTKNLFEPSIYIHMLLQHLVLISLQNLIKLTEILICIYCNFSQYDTTVNGVIDFSCFMFYNWGSQLHFIASSGGWIERDGREGTRREGIVFFIWSTTIVWKCNNMELLCCQVFSPILINLFQNSPWTLVPRVGWIAKIELTWI